MQLKTVLLGAAAASMVSAQDLISVLEGQEDTSILLELLEAYPDLASTLASLEDVTLFAPSNEALSEIQEMGGIFSIGEAAMDAPLVEAILRYHTLVEAVTSDAVTEQVQFIPTLLNYSVPVMDGEPSGSNVTGGQVIQVQLEDGGVVLTTGIKDTANVLTADLEYDNGVVHIIDTLLTIPMSVSGTLTPGNLSALAGAANASDLIDTLDSLSDVTIFAPTNDAFRAIYDATQELSTEALAEILTYHVVPDVVVYSPNLVAGQYVTVEGTELTVTLTDDGAAFVNNARIINTDVLVAGGVIHIIDAVLLPSEADAVPAPDESTPITAAEVPFTSGVPTETSIVEELAASTAFVSAGFGTALLPSSNSTLAEAPVPTQTDNAAAGANGAVGYAALFGGAAMIAAL